MLKTKTYVYLECVVWINDNGQQHREDGPALEYSNGNKYWHLNNVHYTEKDYNVKIKTLR